MANIGAKCFIPAGPALCWASSVLGQLCAGPALCWASSVLGQLCAGPALCWASSVLGQLCAGPALCWASSVLGQLCAGPALCWASSVLGQLCAGPALCWASSVLGQLCAGPALCWASSVLGQLCAGPALCWASSVLGQLCAGPALCWASSVLGLRQGALQHPQHPYFPRYCTPAPKRRVKTPPLFRTPTRPHRRRLDAHRSAVRRPALGFTPLFYSLASSLAFLKLFATSRLDTRYMAYPCPSEKACLHDFGQPFE
ncbi:unnamed protein product [Boreogadus saida]